jgi:hypothetical protein
MSDLNYYALPPAILLPHRTGLTVWGVLMIVFGSLLALSGVGSMAVVGVMSATRGTVDGHAIGLMAMNVVMTGAMGGGLIWLGVGCCRGRRWVRPIVLAGGSVAVVTGLVTIVPVGLMMASTMANPATAGPPQMPKGFMVAMALVGMAFSALLMIGLPAWLVAWFRRPTVAQTLDVLDPHARWTDGVPLPVLAWVLACLWMGGGAVVAAAAGVWFWFTTTLVGWPAIAGAVFGLAVMAAGYGCYRRSAVAWATSVGLFGLMAASAATFVVAGDTAEYQRQMAERTQAFAGSFAPPSTRPATSFQASTFAGGINPQVAPALLYGVAVAYGVWVRRRVVGPCPTKPA